MDDSSDRPHVPVSARSGAVCHEYKVDRPETVDDFVHFVEEFDYGWAELRICADLSPNVIGDVVVESALELFFLDVLAVLVDNQLRFPIHALSAFFDETLGALNDLAPSVRREVILAPDHRGRVVEGQHDGLVAHGEFAVRNDSNDFRNSHLIPMTTDQLHS